jgi:hypothetical protein
MLSLLFLHPYVVLGIPKPDHSGEQATRSASSGSEAQSLLGEDRLPLLSVGGILKAAADNSLFKYASSIVEMTPFRQVPGERRWITQQFPKEFFAVVTRVATISAIGMESKMNTRVLTKSFNYLGK